MKRTILLLSILVLGSLSLNAQKYMTRSGYIGFYSHTPVEDIKAENNQVASILDGTTGELVFQVLMKSFHFEKKLMEEHFNENYVESETYPRAEFKGKITNFSTVNLEKNGKYPVSVEGELTMHGVTRQVMANGDLEVKDGKVQASSKFMIKPEDYGIEIPGIVREKIAAEIEVTVDMKYSPMG